MICSVEGKKPFPNISHMGLLFEGNKKLSKRSGSGTTADYQDISKPALLNWLFKFGWSHPDKNFDQKYPIMSMDDMIKLFNEGRVSGNNCKIDKQKLLFLDKKWRRKSKVIESRILKYVDFIYGTSK
jgi:glutamyl/glutaminyl-tRNA synthetase